MPIEIRGQQLRIRVKNPKLFIKSSFRTDDVGVRGRLQRIAGQLKSNREWETQSWRLNLSNYEKFNDIVKDIAGLRIPEAEKFRAVDLARKWWRANK